MIAAGHGWAEWAWVDANGERSELLIVDDSVVFASLGAREAYAQGGRPALGKARPAAGPYLGQPVAELIDHAGAARGYTVRATGVELELRRGLRGHVVDGRVVGLKRE